MARKNLFILENKHKEERPLIVISRRDRKKFMRYPTIYRGSALKFCLIVEGLADIYPRFGQTYEGDTAAGQCIVECAGGVVVDTQMQPLRYNRRPTLLNPDFFAIGDWLNFMNEWRKTDDC